VTYFSVFQISSYPHLEGPLNFLFSVSPDFPKSYNLNYFCTAPGLLAVSWEVDGPYTGIFFLDKLVEKSPDAVLVLSGEPCTRKNIPLIFNSTREFDDGYDGLAGLFDDYRPVTFDSYFPSLALVPEKAGYLCLDFSASEEEIENCASLNLV
jgi:hypothetical protein